MNPIRTVNTHLIFNVAPTLKAFEAVLPNEVLPSYNCTFKMLLDKKFPERSKEESNGLYTQYLPSLAQEVATRVLDILDNELVPSGKYCQTFQCKYLSIYNAFVDVDCAGCELTAEEAKSLNVKAALEIKGRVLQRQGIHAAIENYVTKFLFPYKAGLISAYDKKAANRPKLILGLEQFLTSKCNPLPFKAAYIERAALNHYMVECAQYILNQFENQTGERPASEEFSRDPRYRIIFRCCLEAVHDAIEIDFPDITLSTQVLRSKLMQKLSL